MITNLNILSKPQPDLNTAQVNPKFDTILTLHNSTCGTSPSKLWHLPKTINLDLRDKKEMYINPIIDNYCRQLSLGVTSKKTNSIFQDIVHIRGGEVNPFSKELKKCFFEKS